MTIRTPTRRLLLLVGANRYANSIAANIPKNDPIKFGFPRVPSKAPYGLLQPTKSPKAITQSAYAMFTMPAMARATKSRFTKLVLLMVKVAKKIKIKRK